ncbi:MAG: hypothetical protein K0S47_4026 [Herbinix sp.]|jgi:glutamine amidotransferase|nr:hypothetical protein [Herbinix sp.]
MIAVIDYGMGNVGSIMNMLKKVGAQAVLASTPNALEEADKIILPGVGAFDTGMEQLEKLGFVESIEKNIIINKKPILGICLGMQMLGRTSEEGKKKGLNLIPFDNIKFHFKDNLTLKVPHMGWNYVTINNQNSKLVSGITEKQRYYFVHTYHALCDRDEDILMRCEYGYTFTASVQLNNIYGTQFHPEKSHNFGMKLLLNFAKEC